MVVGVRIDKISRVHAEIERFLDHNFPTRWLDPSSQCPASVPTLADDGDLTR